jgi:hypothetical protein
LHACGPLYPVLCTVPSSSIEGADGWLMMQTDDPVLPEHRCRVAAGAHGVTRR